MPKLAKVQCVCVYCIGGGGGGEGVTVWYNIKGPDHFAKIAGGRLHSYNCNLQLKTHIKYNAFITYRTYMALNKVTQ